jgi:SOS-response transcriptional repressor LexA
MHRLFAKHVAIPVDGNSLKHMGIHHGDVLICRKTRLYQPGVIGIWETPHGRTAKYAVIERRRQRHASQPQRVETAMVL